MLALWQVFRDQTLKGRVLVLLCRWSLPGCKIVEWLPKHLWQLFWQVGMDLLVCLKYKIFDLLLKWRSVSQTSTEESGKNMFFLFFLLGLKYTMGICFESKTFFAEILSWAEQSGTGTPLIRRFLLGRISN